jgi:hypothetical protein
MGHANNKTIIFVLISLFLSLNMLAQTGPKQSDFYFKDSTTSYEFLVFLGKHFSTDRSKRRLLIFSFSKFMAQGK